MFNFLQQTVHGTGHRGGGGNPVESNPGSLMFLSLKFGGREVEGAGWAQVGEPIPQSGCPAMPV